MSFTAGTKTKRRKKKNKKQEEEKDGEEEEEQQQEQEEEERKTSQCKTRIIRREHDCKISSIVILSVACNDGIEITKFLFKLALENDISSLTIPIE